MRIKAFTLVEVMVSLSILSMVLLGAYGVMNTGNAIFVRDMALLEVQQQTRNAVDRIVRDSRQSSSHVITVNYNNTTNDKFFVTIPTATGIQYYLSGTDLVREYPSGTLTKIANSISLLKFTLTGSLLQVQVRADKTLYGTTISFPLTERVTLRNE